MFVFENFPLGFTKINVKVTDNFELNIDGNIVRRDMTAIAVQDGYYRNMKIKR